MVWLPPAFVIRRGQSAFWRSSSSARAGTAPVWRVTSLPPRKSTSWGWKNGAPSS